ncbi:MAG TPA: hypothetical protein VE820_05910 [Sphingomicrobium sp.]|jgi:hypothetical protein|nr:hypothetical protein [Sphingomicrobium sp.]
MDLSINGARPIPISTSEDLTNALTKWGGNDGDFVILEDGDADYIQSAIDREGYAIEVRDGSTATMYRAVPAMSQPDQPNDRWSRSEAISLISAYFPSRNRRGDAIWENMHARTTTQWFFWVVGASIGLVSFVYKISKS